jgi:hypothetical protein
MGRPSRFSPEVRERAVRFTYSRSAYSSHGNLSMRISSVYCGNCEKRSIPGKHLSLNPAALTRIRMRPVATSRRVASIVARPSPPVISIQ